MIAPRTWRYVLVGIALAVAATRLMALAHSMWQWDEVLFCLGVRHYDVALHNPHPPGYPLFIALGKVARVVMHDDFRALRNVNLLFACLVFPVFYALGRALQLDQITSCTAAVIFSFLPNVWFFGGTALSDVGALVTALAAVAALLRGRDDDRAWMAGSILLGLAAGFRPQTVLLAIYPWLAAAWRRLRARQWKAVAYGAACTAAVVALCYGAAVAATGWIPYRDAMRAQSDYVMRVDSYHNPFRPPVLSLVDDFVLDPTHAGRVSVALIALAAIGLLRARKPALEAVAIFAPSALFMLFYLDPGWAARYAIAAIPMVVFLAAEGIRFLSSMARKPAAVVSLQCIGAAAIVVPLIGFSLPPLREVRRTDAPPVEAIRWVRRNLDPRAATIYVNGSMTPFAAYLLADMRWIGVPDTFSALDVPDARNGWLLKEGFVSTPDALHFVRPRGRLARISRRAYFEASVVPLTDMVRFGAGWHDPEGEGTSGWRWMKPHGVIELPAVNGRGELKLAFDVPLDVEPRPPTVTLAANGQVIDRIVCTVPSVEKTWLLTTSAGRPIALDLSVDEFVNLARMHRGGDSRDLALRLNSISWKPAP